MTRSITQCQHLCSVPFEMKVKVDPRVPDGLETVKVCPYAVVLIASISIFQRMGGRWTKNLLLNISAENGIQLRDPAHGKVRRVEVNALCISCFTEN